LTWNGNVLGEPKFMMGDMEALIGDCPFILMPPKLSSNSDDDGD
jgi:hypothetical protein